MQATPRPEIPSIDGDDLAAKLHKAGSPSSTYIMLWSPTIEPVLACWSAVHASADLDLSIHRHFP